MAMRDNLVTRRLYVRIWLAVAACVTVLGLLIAWGWHAAEAERERQREREREREGDTELRPGAPPRTLIVRGADGQPVGRAEWQRRGGTAELTLTLADGQTLHVQRAPRAPHAPPHGMHRRGGRDNAPPFWLRPPYGFLWVIALAGLAVMAGVYPVARRLTQRLERLQRGVQQWGAGDLAVRVPEDGHDEVADLSRRFNAAAARIEALMAAQRSLLANASHELRSPLARIRMALELMGERPGPAVHAELARNIAELDQLIDEILLASRLDAQEADLGTVEAVDLTGLLAEECARVSATFTLAPGTPASATVPGVAKLLRRAVRNLLENAGRHGAPDGVHAELAWQDGHALIHVSDHGPGVPPALRERIFEPFFRLPGASEREGGVGLGLALVRSIAQRHGGQVRCAERPGGGARFTLRLPVA
ncbi:HAMP domain-containing protein [Comamonadaceae bacterium OH2545_COT-014]|nr:HAMP domain-containing protein [Comamonadaceae bacterium OH2545_COT-014]